MTTCRDVEATSCVGMQFSVESASGLCGNHKPNRLLAERKRIFITFFNKNGLGW